MNRRNLLQALAFAGLSSALPISGFTQEAQSSNSLTPQRLKAGDTVRLVAPAGVIYEKVRIEIAMENMHALGLKPTLGKHVYDRHGYFAGTDKDRADDINQAFRDKSVKAIFALVGGWGSALTLPYLDFDLIRKNPKAIMGYSDITALLNGIYTKTGLITYHGPNATSRWNDFTVKSARAILFEGKSPDYTSPQIKGDALTIHENRIQTIEEGQATGQLVGGNLTVFSSLVGTPYLPDMKGKILFLEEIGESIYRVDRMLSTLKLSGILDDVSGIILGGFTRVDPDGDGFGNFALMDVFERYFKGTGIPTYSGALFGHIAQKHTIPIGKMAKMDANNGTFHLM
jgi:muramoyltetrapeptide carboxypeptidase